MSREIKIEVIEVDDLKFPSQGLLNFLICQFCLFLERKPYIKQGKINSIWNRLESALNFSNEIKADFFLAPEYTLPFSKIESLKNFLIKETPSNSVYCIPVEHLTLEQFQELTNLLRIVPTTLELYFPSNIDSLNRYAKLIFNVAIIAIKDNQGNVTFHLQPKIFPASFEELHPYSFQGGQAISVFKTPRLSFVVMICFDFIGWGGRLPNAMIQWLTEPGNALDFLFILQVNPKPLHREYERTLYRFANRPSCRYTSLFFVNCDSATHLEMFGGEKIEGFNKTAILGKFKLDYTNEYKVEKFIEIPPDKVLGREILQLDHMQRLILMDKGERVVWLRTNTLKDTLSGPSYPRENEIRPYIYEKKSLKPVEVTTIFEYTPIKGPLPDVHGSYRPVTIKKPPIFQGRCQEVSRVLEFLSGKEKCLLIYGEAGIGKSVLAQYTANLVLQKNSQQFSAGLWFSSKDRHLSLRHFIKDFARSLEYPYLHHLDESEQKSEIIHILRDILKGTSIIIIDNVETIRDSNMMAFIEELSDYAKVILTSRNPTIIEKCSEYELGPMKDDDIKQLVQHYWPGIHSSLLPRLSIFLRGSPFTIHLLFSYLKTERLATIEQTIKEIEKSGKGVREWIFQKTWDSLSREAQMIINSFQLFTDVFSKEAIEKIINLSTAEVEELFEKLEKRYFIEAVEYNDPPSIYYQIHPLVRKFSEKKKPKVSMVNQFIKYYRRFVKEHCETENFKHIEQEIRNIERALDLCIEENKLVEYLKIVSHLYYY